MFLLEIFEDGERLEQRGAIIFDEGRQRHLRIDAAIFVGAMRICIEIDEHDVSRQVLQIERDANPKARQRSPEGKEFHEGTPHASCPGLTRASIIYAKSFLKMDHRVKPGEDNRTTLSRADGLLPPGQMHGP